MGGAPCKLGIARACVGWYHDPLPVNGKHMTDKDPQLDDKTLIIDDDQLAQFRKLNEAKQASLIALAGWDIGRQIELSGRETILGRSITAGSATSKMPATSRHVGRSRSASVPRSRERATSTPSSAASARTVSTV